MKASNGLILNIFEGQLDSKFYDLAKQNLYILITHGNISLTTKTISVIDYHPKWNQVFFSIAVKLSMRRRPSISLRRIFFNISF